MVPSSNRVHALSRSAICSTRNENLSASTPQRLYWRGLRSAHGEAGDSFQAELDQIAAGERVGIVGTSGSGKSTLLNILAGYDKPSAGIITVDDHNLLTMTHKEIEIYRRDQIGFVWQQTTRNLFFVSENKVKAIRKVIGIERKQIYSAKTDQVSRENFDLCDSLFSRFSVDFHCLSLIFFIFSVKLIRNTQF